MALNWNFVAFVVFCWYLEPSMNHYHHQQIYFDVLEENHGYRFHLPTPSNYGSIFNVTLAVERISLTTQIIC